MDANGGGPPPDQRLHDHLLRARETREKLTSELRELLAAEEAVHLGLAEQLAASRARRDQTRKALEQLTGESAKYAPKAEQADRTRYEPRQGLLDELLAVLRTAEQPLTAEQILERVTFSHDPLRRGLVTLRERQLVRLAGRGGRTGRAHLYAPMPDGT